MAQHKKEAEKLQTNCKLNDKKSSGKHAKQAPKDDNTATQRTKSSSPQYNLNLASVPFTPLAMQSTTQLASPPIGTKLMSSTSSSIPIAPNMKPNLNSPPSLPQ